jgi:hypothetical protein
LPFAVEQEFAPLRFVVGDLVGGYFPVPVSPERIDEIRECCAKHIVGDGIVDLNVRVLFQRAEEATLAMLWWYAEQY